MLKGRTGRLMAVCSALFLFVFFLSACFVRKQIMTEYETAIGLLEENSYEGFKEAIGIFEALGDYRGSPEYRQSAEDTVDRYEDASNALSQGRYDAAMREFGELGDFADSRDNAAFSRYEYAVQLYREERYNEAYREFAELGDYSDSQSYAADCLILAVNEANDRIYKVADGYAEDGEYENAIHYFSQIMDYKDSRQRIEKCKGMLYGRAISLFSSDQYADALHIFEGLEDYMDSEAWTEKCAVQIKMRRLATTVSAGLHYSLCLKEDGTIICTDKGYDFSGWDNMVSVAGFGTMVIGLDKDGNTRAVGRRDSADPYGIDEIRIREADGWSDIVQVVAGQQFVAALTSHGKVLVDGLDVFQGIEEWENIEKISAGWQHLVALDAEGHVHFAGLDLSGQKEVVESWDDIVDVTTGGGAGGYLGLGHTVGRRSDGTICVAGDNSLNQCRLEGDAWENAKKIVAGSWHTLAITDRDTMVSTAPDGERSLGGAYIGNMYIGACIVDGDGWEDIVDVSGGYGVTIALKQDGSIVASGNSDYGQTPDPNDPQWRDIKVYDEWKDDKPF